MLEEQKNLEVRFIYINFKMNIRYPTIDMKVQNSEEQSDLGI